MLRPKVVVGIAVALAAACGTRPAPPQQRPDAAPSASARPAPPLWSVGGPLPAGQTFALRPEGAVRESIVHSTAAGLLDVDLSDDWAPFIFSESDGVNKDIKPNDYRKTFIALANDRVSPDEVFLDSPAGRAALVAAIGGDKAGDGERGRAMERARRYVRARQPHNFLEPFGIPPTLSVLRARVAGDAGKNCLDTIDVQGLAAFKGEIPFQGRDLSHKEHNEALSDAAWISQKLAAGSDTLESLDADSKLKARILRYRRGQERLRAIRAAQALLLCEGLLSARDRYVDGEFDLPTHEALAAWERKNDIFGWGILGGETLTAIVRPAGDLHFETFRRILSERVADAAGIVEDGSAARNAPQNADTYVDVSGVKRPLPNLIEHHVDALLARMKVGSPGDLVELLRVLDPPRLENFHVAVPAPLRPDYYNPSTMDLAVEIDRGDVWYDFPFDRKGRPQDQPRDHYPQLTLFVRWHDQKIPLARWRTTIGSWRSEAHADGKVYFKYKNSDVGARVWKNVVAAPVWIPPEGTLGKDMLTKKVLDNTIGPMTVVNTDVIGPGFASAYGLVMAIHLERSRGGAVGGFDNQIRTHGSVDYTSIARRFSHGCHRLVNNRAVRLFGFILRHHPFERVGDMSMHHFKKRLTFEGKDYEYEIPTRGYYYNLDPPVPVFVNAGRIMGKLKFPMTTYVRKPGVDYGPAPADTTGTSDETPVETVPVPGP